MNHLRLLFCVVAVCVLIGCGNPPESALLWPAREVDQNATSGLTLVARIAHISDSHMVDIESPARYTGADDIVDSAWRPWEGYSSQLLDGIVRATNRIHQSGSSVSFLVHTGDTSDNCQSNELRWTLQVMDGEQVKPLSGVDDRSAESKPAPTLDPYAAFQAQGLYRSGVHGDLPSIPWYVVPGNHDSYALGTFPIVTYPDGVRRSPLPISNRLGILAPAFFDPTGCWTHGVVTPAKPGPPPLLETPSFVLPNPDRAYFDKRAFKRALFATVTGPGGHGYSEADSDVSWYSVSPAPGLRLIGIDTSDRPLAIPSLPYDHGCIVFAQSEFLRRELKAAQDRGELVIVASHYPSQLLQVSSGSVMGPDDFRALLRQYPNVILHLSGHNHTNRVFDREGYIEIQTCSTLTLPQEGRIVEIWRNPADNGILIGYHMFSHLDNDLPALGDDPLRPMRQLAQAIAQMDSSHRSLLRSTNDGGSFPEGTSTDREGLVSLHR